MEITTDFSQRVGLIADLLVRLNRQQAASDYESYKEYIQVQYGWEGNKNLLAWHFLDEVEIFRAGRLHMEALHRQITVLQFHISRQ